MSTHAIQCLRSHHDLRIVVLALAVCAFSSASIFVQLQRAFESVVQRHRLWVATAALTAGIGVWSTHFIAMVGYRAPASLVFDRSTTALSAAMAVLAFGVSFAWLSRTPSPAQIAAGSLIASAGITSMHLTGMSAITNAHVSINSYLTVGFAAVIGWVAILVAYAALVRLRGIARIWIPALCMVLATATIHFFAMAATGVTLVHDLARAPGTSQAGLLVWIAAATLLLITLTAAASLIDRSLTDLRGLADATSEGLLICRAGRIVEANEQACTLVAAERSDLIGSVALDWFESAAAGPIDLVDGHSQTGKVRFSPIADQCVELSARVIEYRGRAARVIAIRDLTESARAQRAIEHLASHDPLTELVNRAAFDIALQEAVRSGGEFSLLAIDLDRFKAVNDIFGHAAGDTILVRAARLLDASVRPQDLVARVGGDEFIILQRGTASSEDARRLASAILAAFGEQMDAARDPMAVGCSLGVVSYPRDGADPQTLRHNADVALYRAKQEGRGLASFFDAEMDRTARERRSLEHDLRHAICRHQLRVVYQPLVATGSRDTMGYEALLRWTHPDRGEVPPSTFIPVAEEAGSVLALGEWVLRNACLEAASWPSDMILAVNVSPIQLRVPTLPEVVRDALAVSGLPPERLELEITETALLRDREITLRTLCELRSMGVRIAMDDFGTGYSSLSNLRYFPIDKIKIDKSFVSAMIEDDAARSIVRAIAGLGKGLKLPVVAEGVETEAQWRIVEEEGCPQAQGYLFGKATAPPAHTGRLRPELNPRSRVL